MCRSVTEGVFRPDRQTDGSVKVQFVSTFVVCDRQRVVSRVSWRWRPLSTAAADVCVYGELAAAAGGRCPAPAAKRTDGASHSGSAWPSAAGGEAPWNVGGFPFASSPLRHRVRSYTANICIASGQTDYWLSIKHEKERSLHPVSQRLDPDQEKRQNKTNHSHPRKSHLGSADINRNICNKLINSWMFHIVHF